jgi:aldehyde dehydrogenase (NAD+)
MFINGQHVSSKSGETFPVCNPENGEVIAHVPRAYAEDVNAAMLAASNAFPTWAGLPPSERERPLLRAADLVESHINELADLVIDESGSTITKATAEARYAAQLLRAAAGEARRLYGDTFPNDKPHRVSIVIREPLGVIAVISPFNAPLSLFAKMVVFALAAGNCVVAKPSEETPLIAVKFVEILHDAGLPVGVFNVITGYGYEAGKALTEHPDVNGIAFTGSTATGIAIGQAAMTTMKRLQLELGGKNPLLVLNDMDPVKAAEIAAVGAYTHGGQICMSSSRIIAERGIARSFADALTRKAKSLHLGDLRDPRTAYGPLINAKALEKVQRHVQAAIDGGAELLAGGAVHHGLTYQPTVLYAPPRDNIAWREETFGPVAYIVEADDLDEAIAIANESDYGLSAGILTNDLLRGMNAARRIRAGGVHVGMHSFQSDSLAPVGGYGMSGMGRSGGKYSTEHFTELKWINLELGETPLAF